MLHAAAIEIGIVTIQFHQGAGQRGQGQAALVGLRSGEESSEGRGEGFRKFEYQRIAGDPGRFGCHQRVLRFEGLTKLQFAFGGVRVLCNPDARWRLRSGSFFMSGLNFAEKRRAHSLRGQGARSQTNQTVRGIRQVHFRFDEVVG